MTDRATDLSAAVPQPPARLSGSGPVRSSGSAAAPIVLVAHGSRDPRAAAATRALVRAIAAARPGIDVRASFLDHTLPRPGQVLAALQAAGHHRATVVPLLLTKAFHGRVDIPDVVAAARANGLRMPVMVSDVLGPSPGGPVDPLLVTGLWRRLAETGVGMRSGGGADRSRRVGAAGCGAGIDAVVLAAAGTRDATARQTVEAVAAALSVALQMPCRVGYASAASPTTGVAVDELRAAGARRVGVAAYFLAPGLLYETAMSSAGAAGAVVAAAPLSGAGEIARMVLSRAARTELSVLSDVA